MWHVTVEVLVQILRDEIFAQLSANGWYCCVDEERATCDLRVDGILDVTRLAEVLMTRI